MLEVLLSSLNPARVVEPAKTLTIMGFIAKREIGPAGTFFGEATASLSHFLNNRLALLSLDRAKAGRGGRGRGHRRRKPEGGVVQCGHIGNGFLCWRNKTIAGQQCPSILIQIKDRCESNIFV